MRAVVYGHSEPVTLGVLRGALERGGFEITERFREVRPGDAEAELIVVLGGFMGMYELDAHPYLREELSLVEERLSRDRPVLGVCLGAQMMARAAGSHVGPDPKGMFVGAERVTLKDGRTLDIAAWHGDRFEPIPHAESLASSVRHPQEIFRLGRSGIGILTHPEASPETFAQWVRQFPQSVQRAGRSEEELLREDLPRLHAAHPKTIAYLDELVAYLRSFQSASALA